MNEFNQIRARVVFGQFVCKFPKNWLPFSPLAGLMYAEDDRRIRNGAEAWLIWPVIPVYAVMMFGCLGDSGGL